MNLFFKILLLLGAIFLFDKLLDKFETRDKLIRRIDALSVQFSSFITAANETVQKYKDSYDSLAELHKDYQKDVNHLLSQSSHMTEQIIQYSYKMIEDNERLYKRLSMVEHFLTTESPSKEDHEKLIQAIEEDIQLKEEFEKEREEFLNSLSDRHECGESQEMGMGDD